VAVGAQAYDVKWMRLFCGRYDASCSVFLLNKRAAQINVGAAQLLNIKPNLCMLLNCRRVNINM
jgi:hypothetical protein